MCCFAAITAQKQGSYDPNSPWAKARYQTLQQHRLRLGRVKFSELPINEQLNPAFQCMNVSTDHNLPPHTPFTTAHILPPHTHTHTQQEHRWELKQVGWFDETHPKCHIGDKMTRSVVRILTNRQDSRAVQTASYKLMAPCRRHKDG